LNKADVERSPAEILEKVFGPFKNVVEERKVAEFFDKLTSNRGWHGEREKAVVSRFVKLRKLLEANLTDLALLRAGRVRIDIFVFGFDGQGNAAGIRTKSVET
ncbi:MAG: hypothetical protein HOP17_14835, partial [Acidobacteria bacterium]|nr:hypothetical protein [Acidobacteriota bacterium]